MHSRPGSRERRSRQPCQGKQRRDRLPHREPGVTEATTPAPATARHTPRAWHRLGRSHRAPTRPHPLPGPARRRPPPESTARRVPARGQECTPPGSSRLARTRGCGTESA
ncbi:hypothetical protein F1734_15000 [Rhodococcus ruber]|nr:hypothetical protein F1734_15000 [Rhodococcus ruber]RIK12297.1 MAG: hypothetical protein DCC47_07655 [Acidobacteriota bacterium]